MSIWLVLLLGIVTGGLFVAGYVIYTIFKHGPRF